MTDYDRADTLEDILYELIDPNDEAAVEIIRGYLEDDGFGLADVLEVVYEYTEGNLGGVAGIGTLDHRDLEHVTDSDDHTQYHNDTRGDVRYYTKALADDAIDTAIAAAFDAADLDDIDESATVKRFTATLKAKLDGIATAATANSTDAFLRDLANATGTLDSDQLEAGTNVHLFTTARKNAVDALAGTPLPTSTHTAHVADTTGVAHDAQGITLPELTGVEGSVFSLNSTWVTAAIDWTGTTKNLWAWVQEAAYGIYSLDINLDTHKDSLQQHGMPAPGNRLLYRDADGLIPIALAANPPAEGEHPPTGTVWIYNNVGDVLCVHDHDGNVTQLTPANINEFTYVEEDDAGSQNATLRDGITSSTLPVSSWYHVEAELYLTGPNDAGTGDVVVGFSGPAGASFDGTVDGLDPGDAGSDRIGARITRHCTIGTTVPSATQTTAQKVVVKVTGFLRISSTAGAFKIRYSQSSAHATDKTILKANSWMKLTKVF